MNDDAIRSQIRGTTTEDGLLALHAAGGTMSHDDFAAALHLEADRAHEVFLHLDRLGLVRAADYDHLPLNMHGERLADRIARSRLDGPDRRDVVQRAFLQWLADGEKPGSPKDFHGHPTATAYGVPLTPKEISQAAHFLLENGLIQGFQSMAGLQGPSITYEGGYALHSDGLIVDFLKRGGSTTYDNSNTTNVGHGSTVGGIQTGGSHNTQHVTQMNAADQAQALALVGGLLAALEKADGDTAPLRQAVEEIKAEVSGDNPTHEGLKTRVVKALMVAGASESGHLVLQGLAQLLGMTGG